MRVRPPDTPRYRAHLEIECDLRALVRQLETFEVYPDPDLFVYCLWCGHKHDLHTRGKYPKRGRNRNRWTPLRVDLGQVCNG